MHTTTRSRLQAVALAAGIVTALAAASTPAHATFVVDFLQDGPNVVATGQGSIDTADLVVNSAGGIAPFVLPSFPTIVLGPPNMFPPITLFTVAEATGLPPIGTGGETLVSSGSGDEVGFQSKLLVLPQGYQSGAPLSDTDVWDEASFASLGLTPGSYSETFGTGAGADRLVVNVGPLAVPEPAAAALLAPAVAGLLALRRHSRRRSARTTAGRVSAEHRMSAFMPVMSFSQPIPERG